MNRYRIEDADGAFYVRDLMTDRIVAVCESRWEADAALFHLKTGLPVLPPPPKVRGVVLDPDKPPIYGEIVLGPRR